MSTSQAALITALVSHITPANTDLWEGPPATEPPTLTTGSIGALVWVGCEKGGREGGRQAVALGGQALEFEESYLVKGQAWGKDTTTGQPTTNQRIASARGNAYTILTAVETYLATTDPTCSNSVRFAEVENATLSQFDSSGVRWAKVCFDIRAHKRI